MDREEILPSLIRKEIFIQAVLGARTDLIVTDEAQDASPQILPYDGYYGDEEEERYYDNNGMSDNQIAMEERFYEEMRLQREAERYEEIEVFQGIDDVVTIQSPWQVAIYYDESLKRWNTSHPF